jgi:hypothetical protein
VVAATFASSSLRFSAAARVCGDAGRAQLPPSARARPLHRRARDRANAADRLWLLRANSRSTLNGGLMSARRSNVWWLGSWIVAGAAGVAVAWLTPTRAAVAQVAEPDLSVDENVLRSSISYSTQRFKSSDCAVQEACVSGIGRRKLIRFSVATPNLGSADLYFGNPADHPELFVFSPCHGHYHLDGYSTYELLDDSGQTVVRGRKQAFCLRDDFQISNDAGPAKYACDNQGISVGWEDVYGSQLDCQWLDVTNVAPGNYTLRVTINPQRADGSYLFPELDYANNVAVAPVTIARHF